MAQVDLDSFKAKYGVTYFALHIRVRVARGKADRCLIYGCTDTGPFYWANISGHYDDVMDFMPMCMTHHRQYDDDRRGYHLIRDGVAYQRAYSPEEKLGRRRAVARNWKRRNPLVRTDDTRSADNAYRAANRDRINARRKELRHAAKKVH